MCFSGEVGTTNEACWAALIGAALLGACAPGKGEYPCAIVALPPERPRPVEAARTHPACGVHDHQVEVDEHNRRWTTVVPDGGEVADRGTRRRGSVAPAEDVFTFWPASAGCSSTEAVAGGPQVHVARADGRAGTSAVRYRVSGGHEGFPFDTTGAVSDLVSRHLWPLA